jgi:hypothetical protein
MQIVQAQLDLSVRLWIAGCLEGDRWGVVQAFEILSSQRADVGVHAHRRADDRLHVR